jgi:hypothetical protein
MATMTAEPEHQFFGSPGLKPVIGYDAVKEYYLRSFTTGSNRAATDHLRTVVSDDAVVMEGVVMYDGKGIGTRRPDLAAQLDGRRCIFIKHLCVVLPFEGDRIAAEVHYFDGPFSLDDIYILGDDQ